MNAVRQFFRRYIFSTASVLALFFVTDLFLIFGMLAVSAWSGSGDDFSVKSFSGHITARGGTWRADDMAMEMLRREGGWAMLLDDAGGVIWEADMPETLPRSYTVSEVASFSRWYLEDYPVRVWSREDGLLVVGFPPGTMVKYCFSTGVPYLLINLAGIASLFGINLLLMLYFFLRNARRVEKAMTPILSGIRDLADGKRVRLAEKGELEEINTALNRAGEYLLRKDNTRAEWIRGISHDIRTPLSVILGYSSEIEDNAAMPEDVRKQAATIRRQGEKLKELVDDLNLTTKLEYSVQPVRKQRLVPAELARQVVSEFLNDGLKERYEIEFVKELPENAACLNGDGFLLRRMLGNLIRNCIVHNPEGCKIIVSVSMCGDKCFFGVTDDGVGMSGLLIRRYNEGENCFCPQKGGCDAEHGLGLKIVRQIVSAHQGGIRLFSVEPHGLGAEIWLPADR